MTNDEEKNRIIAEALNLCWHRNSVEWANCPKCSYDYPLAFDNWSGLGVIMERGPGKEWWKSFFKQIGYSTQHASAFDTITKYYQIEYISPSRMRDTLSLWLSEHEGEWREENDYL